MSYSPLFSRRNSFLNEAINSLFFGGSDNNLSGSSDSMIIGGSGNTLFGDYNCIVCSNNTENTDGYGNTIFGSENCTIYDYASPSSGCSIIASNSSLIYAASTGSTIFGSPNSSIQRAYYSTIISSPFSEHRGTFSPIETCAIIAGESHQIGLAGYARRSVLIGGYSNEMAGPVEVVENSGILGGQDNKIDSQTGSITRDSFIVGSTNSNIIDGSIHSSIIGCDGVTLDSCSGVTAIGMSAGTISDASYSLYANKINVQQLVHLEPLSSDPSGGAEGDVYYRTGVGLKFFDGVLWRTVVFV